MVLGLIAGLYRARRAVLLTCVGTWLIAAVATHIPAPQHIPVRVSDKTLHLVGFFVLASLFWLSLTAYGVRGWRRMIAVACIMAVYAAIDEATQAWTRRDPDVGDWLADVIGTVLAVGVFEIVTWVGRKTLRRLGAPRAARERDHSLPP